jgi:integrase
MRLDARTVAGLNLPADKNDMIAFDDALPGFGFRLRRSGGQVRRSWIVQYRRVGGTRRILLGSAEVLSAETARAQAKKVLAKVALGEDPQAERLDTRAKAKFTLRAIADDYLAAKQANVRPRTFTEVQRYLTGPYFKTLHNMPVDQIARRDVATRLLIIARESGSVTASRARSALSALFAWAMGEGLAQTNPVVGTNQPKAPPSRSRVLDDAELAAVWRACREDDDIGRIVRLLMLTGARRTEVGGMAWCEIDLERGTWTIPDSRTKNHREHRLPLPAVAQSIIESVPQIVNRDCLFGERASGGFTNWACSKAMLDVRIGSQVRPWTLHDLRRSVATGMATLGVQPHIIEQVLNHQSGHKAGIAGVYNRSPYEREVRAALALWADHIAAITSGGERKVLAFPQERA